ncbi:MAG: hypothetical protein OEM90_13240, partial [Desulfobacteraceae bacterium]|nr:hypothetical protein [Desulfobacteraceae bacterium]
RIPHNKYGTGSPRLKSGGISLMLNLPTWSEPCRKAQKKQMLIVSSSAYFLVRPLNTFVLNK